MKTVKKRKIKSTKARKIRSQRAIGTTKTTTIFMNGQSQAVRIPKEFRLGGKKVYIQKMGNCIILTPVKDPWQLFAESLHEFSDDFMKDGREQLPDQEREDMFP